MAIPPRDKAAELGRSPLSQRLNANGFVMVSQEDIASRREFLKSAEKLNVFDKLISGTLDVKEPKDPLVARIQTAILKGKSFGLNIREAAKLGIVPPGDVSAFEKKLDPNFNLKDVQTTGKLRVSKEHAIGLLTSLIEIATKQDAPSDEISRLTKALTTVKVGLDKSAVTLGRAIVLDTLKFAEPISFTDQKLRTIVAQLKGGLDRDKLATPIPPNKALEAREVKLEMGDRVEYGDYGSQGNRAGEYPEQKITIIKQDGRKYDFQWGEIDGSNAGGLFGGARFEEQKNPECTAAAKNKGERVSPPIIQVTRIDLVTMPGAVVLKKGFEYKLELPEGQELRGWYEKDPRGEAEIQEDSVAIGVVTKPRGVLKISVQKIMDEDTLEEQKPPGPGDDMPF